MYTKKETGLYPIYAELECYNLSSEEHEQIKEVPIRMKIRFKQSQGHRVFE